MNEVLRFFNQVEMILDQLYFFNEKLILKKKVLLEQNFSLKKFDDLSNLQLLLITLDHNLLVNTNISESSSPLKVWQLL